MIKKLLLFLLWVTTPVLANNLDPPNTDISVSLLSSIFGLTDGMLQGTGSQIMGRIFATFNSVIFILAGVLWLYVVISGTINTAHEGEFLGKRWSSFWLPLRMCLGTILLIPKASGYSLIQVFMMYFILQGVGAADRIWETVVQYLNSGGTVFQVAHANNSIDRQLQDIHYRHIKYNGQALKMLTNMCIFENALKRKYGYNVPDLVSSLHIESSWSTGSLPFFGKISGYYNCPNLNQYVGSFGMLKIIYSQYDQQHPNDKKIDHAVYSSVDYLIPLARSIANRLVPIHGDLPTEQSESMIRPLLISGRLSQSAMRITTVFRDYLTPRDKETLSASGGWITAGSYYFELSTLNSLNNSISFSGNYPTLPLESVNSPTAIFSDLNIYDLPVMNAVQAILRSGGVIDQYIQREGISAGEGMQDPIFSFPQGAGYNGQDIEGVLSKIIRLFIDSAKEIEKQINQELQSGKDAVVTMLHIGNHLIRQVENAWVGMLSALALIILGVIGVSLGSGLFMATGVASAINVMLGIISIIMIFTPLFVIWMSCNFALGAALAYYVPFIPYMLFFFSSLTWIGFVIEAMIAAPLICLGITHPDGHDMLGKAEQAIMLIMSIFLRPLLILFGFIVGMIMSYFGISFFNVGFSRILGFILKNNQGDFLVLVSQIALTSIYTISIITIINQSFAMIYEVPNRVLRWIGGPVESYSAAEALGQIKASTERFSSDIGGQVSSKIGHTAETFGKQSHATGSQIGQEKRQKSSPKEVTTSIHQPNQDS